MKTETNIHELAIRYFEGHISKAEEKLLFSYIEQAEENRLRFRQWEKEWKVTNEGDEQTMHEWQRLQRRLRIHHEVVAWYGKTDRPVACQFQCHIRKKIHESLEDTDVFLCLFCQMSYQ